jgi:hypothetical protein
MSDTDRSRETVDRLLARGRDSLQEIYDATIRRRLPRTLGVYNGVVTRRYYLLDLSKSENEPQYKERLVGAVREAVEPGDTVVEVGAGFGVCTTWAARATGDGGRVLSLEANAEQTDVVREALELTGQVAGEALSERVDVRHAIVGSELKTYGPMAGAARVDPSELPACDALVMDCEGAELGVLRGTSVRPRTVVVETHPAFGAPTSEVVEVLSSMGYESEASRVTTKPEGAKDVVTATLESGD